MSGRVTRGFLGKRRGQQGDRLPPGQYDVGDGWPTLTAEATPRVSTEEFELRLDGLVEHPSTWSWEELRALPRSTYAGDIHCVTTWSKFDMTWTGVSLDLLLDQARPRPEAAYALVHSSSGYTTNLPLADLRDAKAWVAWEADGQPLSREHGGPARLLVPHLYFWKSAKWVSRIELLDTDQQGFWERNGYHDRGDPWAEQRYQGD
ncbi:sulfite oxidase-like oxidoreductase [Nocardioides korecus]